MKFLLLCAVLLFSANAAFSMQDFTQATLQSVQGWAYPLNFGACFTKAGYMAKSYANFLYHAFSGNYDIAQFYSRNLLSWHRSKPRCYFFTNLIGSRIANSYYSILYSLVTSEARGALDTLRSIIFFIFIVPSFFLDFGNLVYDLNLIVHGRGSQQTIGYIFGLFLNYTAPPELYSDFR